MEGHFIKYFYRQHPGFWRPAAQPVYEGGQQTGGQEGQAAVVMPLLHPMEMEHPGPRQVTIEIIFRRNPVEKKMSDIQTDA